MLEKDLLHEQICRLNDRIQKKVDAHRDTALNVAQQVASPNMVVMSDNTVMLPGN